MFLPLFDVDVAASALREASRAALQELALPAVFWTPFARINDDPRYTAVGRASALSELLQRRPRVAFGGRTWVLTDVRRCGDVYEAEMTMTHEQPS